MMIFLVCSIRHLIKEGAKREKEKKDFKERLRKDFDEECETFNDEYDESFEYDS